MSAAGQAGASALPRAGRRGVLAAVGLVLLILALAAASLLVGPAGLSWRELLEAALSAEDSAARIVLLELRLPRTLLALLVGGSLGLAGAALQGLFRNPLAEPGVIGVSSCAALGAVTAFYTGAAIAIPLGLPLSGMAGSVLAMLILMALVARDGRIATLLLAGVALTSLSGALTALALNLSPNPYAAVEIAFWLMGSLADRGLDHVALVLPFMLAGWAVLLGCGRGLEALSLGEDTARSLGVQVGALRLRLLLGTALAVGSGVAVSGAIGFVGLIVPHLLRPLVDHRPAPLLWLSLLGGAALTLAADIAVRLLGGEVELRLGVATAVIGAPFFLWLVLHARRERP